MTKDQIIRNIAFFGDANISEEDPVYLDAYKIAELLAKEGYKVVNGGGPGVMEAATSGAKAGGGKTLSITFNPTNAPGYEGKYLKNITDKQIVTTNYIDRMFSLLEHGDLFIIFKGGSGTMSEFGTSWVLAKLYYGHHKPFILFGEFWIEIIDALKKNMNLDQQELSVFEICTRVEDVLPTVQRFEKKIEKREHNHNGDSIDEAFMD